MFKITGLDKLTGQLNDAEKALDGMNGALGTVSFDPHDPTSIEGAMQSVDAMVDERLGAFSSNPIIGPVATAMKEKYRQAILDRAAAARLANGKAE